VYRATKQGMVTTTIKQLITKLRALQIETARTLELLELARREEQQSQRTTVTAGNSTCDNIAYIVSVCIVFVLRSSCTAELVCIYIYVSDV
jgi:hypothetical protein